MAVTIGSYSTASFGTAGSMFGSTINLNYVGGTNKTLNADNFPLLVGQLPAYAFLALPAGTALEFTNDGGTTWTQAISGVGSNTFLIDGFTTRIAGASSGNVTFVALRAILV